MERNMKMPIRKRIENDFTYHTPPKDISAYFILIREKAKELAHLIVDTTPESRERATALTRLEECVMHANASIARQYPADKL